MPRYAYTAQQKINRFTPESPSFGWDGLYTDGFSSCNIINLTTRSGYHAQIHCDTTMPLALVKNEVEYLASLAGEVPRIQIVFRPTHEASHSFHIALLAALDGYPVESISADESIKGVLLRTVPSPDTVPVAEVAGVSDPRDILPAVVYHPEQLKFENAIKIETFFKMSALEVSRPVKTTTTFNGHEWCAVKAAETSPNHGKKKTGLMARFMGRLNTHGNNSMGCASVVGGIIDEVQRTGTAGMVIPEGEVTYSIIVGRHLFRWLSNYNNEAMLKADVADMLAHREADLSTAADRAHHARLLGLLRSRNIREGLGQCYDELNAANPAAARTAYLKDVISELKDHLDYYDEFSKFTRQAERNRDAQTVFDHQSECGTAAFQRGEFAAAESAYREALLHATAYVTSDNRDISTLYYNLGRSLQEQGPGRAAETACFFARSYELKKAQSGEMDASTKKALNRLNEVKATMLSIGEPARAEDMAMAGAAAYAP